jgi:trans-2,3-dihydro-3-hydroxyanthranilate isomerase
MRNFRFIQLDVFTNQPFAGNPLAVFPEAEGLTDEQMMKIAREMNLSETVFVLRPEESKQQTANSEQQKPDSKGQSAKVDAQTSEGDPQRVGATNPQFEIPNPKFPLRCLRIFTPAREIPFAGHPIAGTWNALAREGIVPLPEGGNGWTRIHHEVGIGVLPVDIEFKDGAPVQVVMTQGKFEILDEIDDGHEQAEFARALGRDRDDLDENLPIQVISTGLTS